MREASGRRRWISTAFNEHPEPYATYFFHMTLGHHGFFSLTPIFLLSAVGAVRLCRDRRLVSTGAAEARSAMPALAWLTIVLTAILLAFYTWNPKARNYGGSTQGLRWLFWLIPFWLLALARGARMGSNPTAGFAALLSLPWAFR